MGHYQDNFLRELIVDNFAGGGGTYDTDGFWVPTTSGLGMARCIDELNRLYGKDFIKY